MAAAYDEYTSQNSSSSQRAVAMMLALVTAVVLSPLYMNQKNDKFHRSRHYDSKWSSGFVLPVLLAGLIVAIKTTTLNTNKNNSASRGRDLHLRSSMDSGEASTSQSLRAGSSSWGLAGLLVLLVFLLSWQSSAQHLFWR